MMPLSFSSRETIPKTAESFVKICVLCPHFFQNIFMTQSKKKEYFTKIKRGLKLSMSLYSFMSSQYQCTEFSNQNTLNFSRANNILKLVSFLFLKIKVDDTHCQSFQVLYLLLYYMQNPTIIIT